MSVEGTVLPCCHWEGDCGVGGGAPKIQDGIQNAIDSEYFNSIRERMLAGEELSECRQCLDEEKHGAPSMREDLNEQYGKYIGKTPKLRYIELAFSTHCNLACRICNESYSSKWKLINNPKLTVDTSVAAFDLENYDVDLSELDVIKVVGGEPFLSKNHYDYLNKFISQSTNPNNVIIEYYTNGTVFPNKNIIDYWKKLKEVRISISVDGFGTLNDYLRSGSSWKKITETVDKFMNIEDVNIVMGTHTVITSLNVLQLPKLVEWIVQTFGEFDVGSFDVARYPEHLSIVNLADEEKDKIRTGINIMKDKMGGIEQVEILFDVLEEALNENSDGNYTFEDIAKKEQKLDKYFKQDFWDYIEIIPSR
jgi:MoaA/NifB/PqqE/SkfB family radical SAM enzyme